MQSVSLQWRLNMRAHFHCTLLLRPSDLHSRSPHTLRFNLIVGRRGTDVVRQIARPFPWQAATWTCKRLLTTGHGQVAPQLWRNDSVPRDFGRVASPLLGGVNEPSLQASRDMRYTQCKNDIPRVQQSLAPGRH
ncbi:hypothetical protein F441_09009 [Phytophthora nicotianae CJ01A1]|uniref:Uncharacterized protein n=2 Tax=Phytophthora nicotianae TaxID=4792 RepID=W2X0S7_PHYNI|nr:hypothetical protein L916_08788 [Phytophthora nicotianae]ETP16366.1 hypothetical protein F441_09009 [Phytophthora nicotianae CJ01A1]